jgi:hypothetical protein
MATGYLLFGSEKFGWLPAWNWCGFFGMLVSYLINGTFDSQSPAIPKPQPVVREVAKEQIDLQNCEDCGRRYNVKKLKSCPVCRSRSTHKLSATTPQEEVRAIVGQKKETEMAGYIVELEKLAELYEKGYLTKEEFDTKKRQILGLR